MANRMSAVLAGQKPSSFQTSHAAIPMRTYNVVQTGPNMLPGGFHTGLLSDLYQVSTSGLMAMDPRTPTPKQIPMKTTSPIHRAAVLILESLKSLLANQLVLPHPACFLALISCDLTNRLCRDGPIRSHLTPGQKPENLRKLSTRNHPLCRNGSTFRGRFLAKLALDLSLFQQWFHDLGVTFDSQDDRPLFCAVGALTDDRQDMPSIRQWEP